MAEVKRRIGKPAESFVLHSVVLAWSCEDEVNEYSDVVLERLADTKAIVPARWP